MWTERNVNHGEWRRESSSEYEEAISWMMWKESVALLRKRERVLSEKEKVLVDVMASGRGLGNKRKLDEWEVSDIEESKAAIVYGIVTQLSPAHVSKKSSIVRYFDGKVAGKRKCACLVCFDPSLRALCVESQANKTPMKFINCQVKQPGNQAPAEIVLCESTCCGEWQRWQKSQFDVV